MHAQNAIYRKPLPAAAATLLSWLAVASAKEVAEEATMHQISAAAEGVNARRGMV